jgi:flagellar hook-associated protein 2
MISLNTSTLLNGAGIDVTSLVTQILAQDNSVTPLLQQQQTDLQTQAGLLTTMNGDLSSLSSAVNSLADVLGPLSEMTAESSQTSILTASAQSSATPGTHTVVVSTLATQGTLYTDAVQNANTSILPSGVPSANLQFQVGGSSGATHSIAISGGSNDTLTSLANYINAQGWGVTANVITDTSGARLAIYSNASGSTGSLAITSNTSSLTFNPAVGGTNATFTVDGIPFSSTTNTVTGAIPGVTLNLLGAYPGVQVQVSIAPDSAQAVRAVGDFVSAYNAVVADLNKQFTVDPSTNTEGPLASDSSLRSLQSSLLANATYSPPASTLYTSTVKNDKTSILPTGVSSADFQFQMGGSNGPIHDVSITAGNNDTLATLANYINQQNWGVTSSVQTDATGSRLEIYTNTFGASSALTVVNNTTSLSFSAAAPNQYVNMRSLGITMNDDGTLSIDAGKLTSVLTNDPTSLVNFFQNTAQTGFANQFAKTMQNLTDPTLGLLNMDLAQNRTQQGNLSNSLLDIQDRMATEQKQLELQYSAVNALLQSFPYQLQAVQLELGITPSGSSNSGQ